MGEYVLWKPVMGEFWSVAISPWLPSNRSDTSCNPCREAFQHKCTGKILQIKPVFTYVWMLEESFVISALAKALTHEWGGQRLMAMSKTIQKTWEKLACGFRYAGWERNGKMGTFFKQEESLHFNSVLFKRAKKRNICRWGKMGASVFKNKKKSISNKLQNKIPNWFHVSIIKLQNNFNCTDFHFPLSKG